MIPGLNEALLKFLNGRGIPAIEIIDFEDSTESDGFCETCYYEYAAVRIIYKSAVADREVYVYRDSFADLVKMLGKS